MSLLEYANPFHAYVFATSFWYFLRGIVRFIDPATVVDWFRPPSQLAEPNDLELYTTRVDAFGLLALAGVLLVISDAVPLPDSMIGSTLVTSRTHGRRRDPAKLPYARAVVLITILHHIATGIGSYTHWRLDTHRTVAMDIGVFGNIALTGLGIIALVYGFGEHRSDAVDEIIKEAREFTGAIEEVKVGGHSLRKRA